MDAEEIDPRRMYPFSEAARLIPSCRAGKMLSVETLHRWVRAGLLLAECRESGGKRYWFVSGQELLRLQAPAKRWQGITPAELNRAHERATAKLRKRGWDV